MTDIRIQQAARRLRAIASTTSGYGPALLNLAGEIEAADEGAEYVPEAAAAGMPPRTWALKVAAAVIFGELCDMSIRPRATTTDGAPA